MRGQLLAVIRDYFRQEGVAEALTPTLGSYGVTDPNLVNLRVEDGEARLFLQTSPEYAMKKLLAHHPQSIYQICPAYRGGEIGPRHRREFLMLEWYRCDYTLTDLMDDLARLFAKVTADFPSEFSGAGAEVRRHSYKSLFMEALEVNPHSAPDSSLASLADSLGLGHLGEGARREDYLDGLFATAVEPGLTQPVMVYDYPACQAALACHGINQEGEQVADRFEFFAGGMELANAYNELRDPEELAARFSVNNQVRQARGLPQIPPDTELLSLLARMPPTAGIALGIDRLLMLLTGNSSL